MRADLAAFDLRGLDVAGGLADPLGGFLLAGSQTRAKLTVVDGNIRVRDGKLVGDDESAIAAQTNACSRALSDRLPCPPSRSTGRRAPSGS